MSLPRRSAWARCTALVLWMACVPAAAAETGQFRFDEWSGPGLDVYYAHPRALKPDMPVIFVMHGMSRTAQRYRDEWATLAVDSGFVVIAPHFDSEHFPGLLAYNLGNTFDEHGRPQPEEAWSFSAIEPLFDAVRARFGLTAEHYQLYGHSAGAQFVHRFLAHVPGHRVERAVAANAGWYTLPGFGAKWPYGYGNSQVTRPAVEQLLAFPLMVLLGDRDTEMADPSLRSTPEAQRQGSHRLARGFYYYEAGIRAAQHFGVELGWTLAKVEGADHDNAKMAPAAAHFLLQAD